MVQLTDSVQNWTADAVPYPWALTKSMVLVCAAVLLGLR